MKEKLLQRVSTLTLALLVTLGLCTATTFAEAAPSIEDVEYDGKGKVEVEFIQDVEWKNAKVTVKDTKGKKYKASIVKKDDDEIKFKIKKYKKNRTYRFTIKGVRVEYGGGAYTKVTGTVKIPKAGTVKIKDVDYDAEDREVEFEFKGKVSWNSPKVKITDGSGKNYVTRIKKMDNDEIEVKVKGLTQGKKYSYTITGVKARGAKDGITVKGSFRAIDD